MVIHDFFNYSVTYYHMRLYPQKFLIVNLSYRVLVLLKTPFLNCIQLLSALLYTFCLGVSLEKINKFYFNSFVFIVSVHPDFTRNRHC